MFFTAGLVLLAAMIGMIVIARPSNGLSAAFLQSWVVGQVYALWVLGTGVVGVSMLLTDLPF
jgi:hypothetical protein